MNKKRFYDEFKDTSEPENSQRYMPGEILDVNLAMFNAFRSAIALIVIALIMKLEVRT